MCNNDIYNTYKLSKYNFIVEIPPKNTKIRVMNLFSRAIVEFDCSKEYFPTYIEENLDKDSINYLMENKFIVNKDTNEYQNFRNYFSNRRQNKDITFTIGFSMNCNFNCLYCIQKGNYSTKNNFTLENLDKLYEWVSKPIIEKKRDITINIFGGEPTLNIKGVLYFLEKMNVLANKLKVKKYYQMVTNGYLLNQEIIRKLYDLGVSEFQITLDGVKEEHDRRRSVVFKSFDKIVENIILINKLGGIVYILHVFDESNINSGKKLVDYFDEISNIHSLSKNTIYFNFVVTIPKKTELVKCNSYVYGKEKYLTKEGVDNAVYAFSKGFNIVNTLEISCCFRQLGNSFLITPDLKLYKCYSTFGNEKYSIETIENISYNEFANKYSLEMMYSDGFSKKCEHCNFVPFCRGGCQFAASEENNGQYGYPFCEKAHMQEQLKGFILNDIYQ